MFRFGVSVLVVSVFVSAVLSAASTSEKPTAGGATEDKVEIVVLSKPETCDRESKEGDALKVHYTGTLDDGTKFDSSHDRGQPITFQLGAGRVIAGWEKGLLAMCIGERRMLTVPASLGYGDRDMGNIPPNSVLHFEVELIDIEKGVSYAPLRHEVGSLSIDFALGIALIAGTVGLTYYAWQRNQPKQKKSKNPIPKAVLERLQEKAKNQ